MNPALPASERGKWSSLALAAFVHVALGLFLFYGVRWQNRPPEPDLGPPRRVLLAALPA